MIGSFVFFSALAHIASYKVGAIAVPLFVLFGPDAVEYRLKDCGAKVVIVEPGSLDTVLSLRDSLPDLKHIILAPPLSSVRPMSTSQLPAGVLPLSSLLANASPKFAFTPTLAEDPAVIICACCYCFVLIECAVE